MTARAAKNNIQRARVLESLFRVGSAVGVRIAFQRIDSPLSATRLFRARSSDKLETSGLHLVHLLGHCSKSAPSIACRSAEGAKQICKYCGLSRTAHRILLTLPDFAAGSSGAHRARVSTEPLTEPLRHAKPAEAAGCIPVEAGKRSICGGLSFPDIAEFRKP
jgi:hypothetical protein